MTAEIAVPPKRDIELGFAKVSATGEVAVYMAFAVVLTLVAAMALFRWRRRRT